MNARGEKSLSCVEERLLREELEEITVLVAKLAPHCDEQAYVKCELASGINRIRELLELPAWNWK